MSIDWVSIISAVAVLISAIAAVFWGRGLAAAKDEIIKTKDTQIGALRSLQDETLNAKDAQINTLKSQVQAYRELNPMKIREYFLSVTAQMETRVEDLEEELAASQVAINQKDAEIIQLKADGRIKTTEIKQLETEISNLKGGQDLLREHLRAYQETKDAMMALEITFGKYARVWNEEQEKWQFELSMGDAIVIGNNVEMHST